jgi:hypothetical protein
MDNTLMDSALMNVVFEVPSWINNGSPLDLIEFLEV